jgi:hypothetical protein
VRAKLAILCAVAIAVALVTGTAGAVPAPGADTFGGPTAVHGPGASTTWYFGEGTTRAGFDEFLLVFNPGAQGVSYTATYLVDGGASVTKSHTVPAASRQDVKVWNEIGRGFDHGTRIDATGPIVVERAMYMTSSFDNVPGMVDGATSVFGQTATHTEWDFAEGTTLPGFQTYYLVSNPGDADISVSWSLSPQGGSPATGALAVPAKSRRTLIALDAVGAGQVGIYAKFTSAAGFVGERATYFNASIAGSDLANGAHAGFGTLPANEWTLAEGNVLPGWYEFLTLGNPSPAPVKVLLEYMFEGTPGVTKSVMVPANGRATVQVFSADDPAGVGRDVSDPLSRGVSLHATATDPFVIERPMYFPGVDVAGLTGVNDGHVSAGLSGRPALSYVFAEGTTLGGFQPFWTFSNPNDSDAAAVITYYTATGQKVSRPVTVPAHQRLTTQIASAGQVAAGGALGMPDVAFGAVIESTNGVSFVVERPIYERYSFEDIGAVNGATDVTGRPGGSALSVTKMMPASVAKGAQSSATITLNVFEAGAEAVSVVETFDAGEGTGATYVPGSSAVPASFVCAGSGSDVVCSATGDVAAGSYTFTLAFILTNSTGAPAVVTDEVIASAENTETSMTTGQTTVGA